MIKRLACAALATLISLPAQAGMWGVAAQVSTTGVVPTVAQLQSVVGKDDQVRDVLGWHRVEPVKGAGYVMPPVFAQLYANVQQAGLHNVVTLGFGNKDYGTLDAKGKPSDMALPTTPEALAGFANYAGWVVKNVPNLAAVAIWNECNGSFCFGGPTERQANYINLLKSAVPIIRASNPSVKIIAGATVGWNINGWFINIGKTYDWKQVDYLDIHPYIGDEKTNPLQSWQSQIKSIRAAGITNPAFYTEWGGPSAVKMGPAYISWFTSNVAAADPVKPAGADFFTIFGNQGLIGSDGAPNAMGTAFKAAQPSN